MIVHETAKQSDGRDWFTHLSIIECGGRFFVLHHEMPVNFSTVSLSGKTKGNSMANPLNPIGCERVVIKAVSSFNESSSKRIIDYVMGYLEAKGLPNFNIFNGCQD